MRSPVLALSDSFVLHLRRVAERAASGDAEAQREHALVRSTLRGISDGRHPTHHLDGSSGHRYDLSDCDKHYMGTSQDDREAGLPAYRLVTRELWIDGQCVVEVVASGDRSDEAAYSAAARVLGRGLHEEALDLYEPLPETLARLQAVREQLSQASRPHPGQPQRAPHAAQAIRPAPDAPSSEPEQSGHDHQPQA